MAAKVLGITPNALRLSVSNDPQLRAIWLKGDVVPPSEADTINRNKPPIIAMDAKLAEAFMRQNREILRSGLARAGVKDSTIEKLKVFDDFAPNAGEYLIASLDLSHRMMLYMAVQLLERGEQIKTDYLDDATLDEEIKIEWQKAYNEIAEIIGRNFDRTLTATQAMAKMMGSTDDGKKKNKPKFKALRTAQKT